MTLNSNKHDCLNYFASQGKTPYPLMSKITLWTIAVHNLEPRTLRCQKGDEYDFRIFFYNFEDVTGVKQ